MRNLGLVLTLKEKQVVGFRKLPRAEAARLAGVEVGILERIHGHAMEKMEYLFKTRHGR